MTTLTSPIRPPSQAGPATDDGAAVVDVLVVGAGITGIYQLYRALEEGFSARLLEAGDGVGGTWYWNRYPGCRFDSESYTYGYLFSEELFDEWVWEEQFAPQTETERYLNHVVDRFDLRRHIRFGARVTSAEFDEESGTYRVVERRRRRGAGPLPGRGHRACSQCPTPPTSPAETGSAASRTTPACGRESPVDFSGKRVAVIGTSSSGVQIVPAIVDDVASLTVYQRTANWCTPLNNGPSPDEEQAQLRAGFEAAARDAQHLGARVPPPGQ